MMAITLAFLMLLGMSFLRDLVELMSLSAAMMLARCVESIYVFLNRPADVVPPPRDIA